MKDEEFVKLRFWIDAELTLIRVMLALILGMLIDKRLVWIAVVIYVIFSLLYAATRIAYVESKHMGYMRIPRR